MNIVPLLLTTTALGAGGGAPTLQLSSTSVAEDATVSTVVGTLSVANLPDGVTVSGYSITADPDSKFDVSSSNLITDATLDYETATSHSVTIRATLSAGDPVDRTFAISVTDVAEPPAQFATDDWSVADAETDGEIVITITSLPDPGDASITDIEYQIDGGSWVSLGDTALDDYTISGLTNDVEIDVAIRAVSASGNGTASATKAVTPTIAMWTPAVLFASGEEGVWYEPSPSTCFTDAGTTPATVGDAVYQMNDLSGNGNHAIQATAANRPILRQTGGGLYYLEFDGATDFWNVSAGFTSADMDFFAGVDPESDAEYILVCNTSGGASFGVAQDGNGSTSYFAISGTPTILVDGSVIGGTRDNLHDAATGGAHVIEYQGLGLASFGSVFIGNFTSSGFDFGGKLFSMIASESLTAGEITDTRTYVAAKSGVTL